MINSRNVEMGYNEKTPILHRPESSNSPGPDPSEWRHSRRVKNSICRWHECIPARYAFALLSSAGFFNVYAMRVNLSVALVAMVGKQVSSHMSHREVACEELMSSSNSSDMIFDTPVKSEFDWDAETQANVLGAFFVGYIFTQIPGGTIAERFGGKWLFGLGILITAICTLLTPLAANWGVKSLIIVRIIEGLGEGVTFPAMNALIGRWIPKLERSRMATVIYNGSPIGTVVSLYLSGYISASDHLGGWPTVFYLFGTVGCIWFLFWVLLIHESPEEHPRISKEELQYILSGQDEGQTNRSRDPPWRAILTSCPVWALAVTHFGFNWGFYTLLTELPNYLSNILHFELKQNGLLSAAPYVCQVIFAIWASFIADKMRASGRFRITTIRKIMNSVAFYLPCLSIGLVTLIGCRYEVIIMLIMASVAFSGFMYSGFNVTHVDMSPEFAGTLMGITNCIANFSGYLAPRYVGYIIKDGQSVRKWNIVFLTAAVIYFVTGTIYNFFGSAELQPWGISQPSPSDEETDEKTSTNKERTSTNNED